MSSVTHTAVLFKIRTLLEGNEEAGGGSMLHGKRDADPSTDTHIQQCLFAVLMLQNTSSQQKVPGILGVLKLHCNCLLVNRNPLTMLQRQPPPVFLPLRLRKLDLKKCRFQACIWRCCRAPFLEGFPPRTNLSLDLNMCPRKIPIRCLGINLL